MQKVKVTLLEITPEHVVNRAISMPYDSEPSPELTRKVIGIKKHLSCAEHIVMNFIIEGSSRLELQEHMRHRMASPTVKSSRYTIQKDVAGLDIENLQKLFVYPDTAQIKDEYAKICFDAILQEVYDAAYYAMCRCKAAGVPNDFVKYILPEGLRTSFSWTINLRSFINFLELRTDVNAHFEIRHIAKLMREEIGKAKKAAYVDKILKEMGL